jgi:glycosyltransferase involved in cell wall biosynthesis
VFIAIQGPPARVERITKIVTSLRQLGARVYVVCPSGSEVLREYDTIFLPYLDFPFSRSWSFSLQLFLLLIRRKPNLVHFVNYPDFAIVSVCLAKYQGSFKVVYDKRSQWSKIVSYVSPKWRSVASIVTSLGECLSDGISVVVPSFKDELSRYGRKVAIVPNGVDLQMFKPERFENASPTVACVGGLTESEGPRIFIQAASIVRKRLPEVEFVWVGSGWGNEDQTYKQLSDDLGAGVRFTGWVEHTQVSKHINNATVCVSPVLPWPSSDVAFPVKLFEYLACMKPVVVSNTRGHLQLISHGVNGLVYDCYDAFDLAEKVVAVLTNPVLREELAKQGRKLAEQYSWENCFKRLLYLYRKVGVEIPASAPVQESAVYSRLADNECVK